MKKVVCLLAIFTLILGSVAAALWLLPFSRYNGEVKKVRYGLHEGLELVETKSHDGRSSFAVENGKGEKLFDIPVHDCTLDVRYRDGLLMFRENATGREGYIDRNGMTAFIDDTGPVSKDEGKGNITIGAAADAGNSSKGKAQDGRMTDRELKRMAQSNPFYKEAVKILSGKLSEDDADKRRMILNYCEHLRAAYTTKDIDFLKQVFSEHALIIVGNVVRERPNAETGYMSEERVIYNIRTKKEYIERLGKAFAENKKINVRFSDFRIMRHPTMEGIYGVTLRQQYKSEKYSDDGYLFLLWDFRDKSMPLIHVRTWQPAKDTGKDGTTISISDFNLE